MNKLSANVRLWKPDRLFFWKKLNTKKSRDLKSMSSKSNHIRNRLRQGHDPNKDLPVNDAFTVVKKYCLLCIQLLYSAHLELLDSRQNVFFFSWKLKTVCMELGRCSEHGVAAKFSDMKLNLVVITLSVDTCESLLHRDTCCWLVWVELVRPLCQDLWLGWMV